MADNKAIVCICVRDQFRLFGGGGGGVKSLVAQIFFSSAPALKISLSWRGKNKSLAGKQKKQKGSALIQYSSACSKIK